MATPVVDVGHLLDQGRWTAYQKWLVALVALTIVFDGIDNQLLGIVIPTVMREWGAAQRVRLRRLAGLRRDDDRRRACRAGRRPVRPADGAARQHGRVRRDDAGRGDGRRHGDARRRSACRRASGLAARCRTRRRWPPSTCRPTGARSRSPSPSSASRSAPRSPGCWRIRRCRCRLADAVPHRRGGAPRRRRRAAMGAPESPRYLARHPERWRELRMMRRMGHHVAATPFVDSGDGPSAARPSRRCLRPSSAATPSRCGARSSRACWASTWASAGCRAADRRRLRRGHRQHRHHRVQSRRRRRRTARRVGIARFGSRAAMLAMAGARGGGAVALSLMTISPAGACPIIAMLTLTGA